MSKTTRALEERVAALERKLVARDKTIAVLTKRVEGCSSANASGAFATFEENIRLERVVARKTEELKAAQEDLLREMEVQRSLEVELRQAQKLEAVGRLAAGVAHEINTPIQYVGDSLEFTKEAVAGLVRLATLGRGLASTIEQGGDGGECARQWMQLADEADLDYSIENLEPAMKRASEGLNRVATIVRALKRFAHPGAKETCSVDLNEAVASTLLIAATEYKYVADVVTNYGELPPVTCQLGDLNQAILNLLVNAAHAIADAGRPERGTITVRTLQLGPHVHIEIADNGCGIPVSIRERIFEPFFTTKDVGRGSGQGLALVRSVVNEHGGDVSFDSVVGAGTTFRLRLPISGPAAKVSAPNASQVPSVSSPGQ